MQSRMAMLTKSKTLIKTLNPTKTCSSTFLKSISTFSFLDQEPQLAEQPPAPPSPTPLPPNPATGSPLYHENWRNRIPNTGVQSLIPVGFVNQPSNQIRLLAQTRDVNSLKDLFADWMTQMRWQDIIELFEVWIRSLDEYGKPNRPDVLLYNHYLRAYLMRGASAAEFLDLVGKMDDFAIEPNTASFNLVLKAMHRAVEVDAAEKLLERMLLIGKESKPDYESYNLVLTMLFRRDKIDDALKYMGLALESGCMLSPGLFAECVRSCLRGRMLDSLVLVIEKCKAMDQSKNLCPYWNLCIDLARVAIRNGNSRLAFLALEFIAKSIAAGEKGSPPIYRSADEDLIISALSVAGQTYDSTLLDASWAILRRSLRDRKHPEPQTYLAKICALASLGNLQGAFSALYELETVHANSASIDEEALFSPFTSLYPLVVACSKKGFETLDLVYFQLENLSRANPPYKSVNALNCVILGCANIWDLDRAYQTFEAIGSTFGLSPNIHSYNALMYALGKLRKTEEATRVFEHVTSLGLKPNAMSYSLLVDAHLVNRDPKAALAMIDAMVEAGFEPTKKTLSKVRRRSLREMDDESYDQVAALAQRFKIIMPDEFWRNTLFNLQYTTQFA